ncbi:hypothetical protein BDY19DRAFT_1070437 [Irpex rosettiformis]|uniref:Uncharacterized protein n=1 Tax=Irpex rosettiformis TaxID=378272 RepID=A0ACB8U484_9APHY|nr:hypothetical protein BDY19DRAFT_1070437 [Irpex rosettiformis]
MANAGSSTEAARQFLRGEREYYVVSHAGKSQYSAGGTSSCGLAALNCARLVLQRAQSGSFDSASLLRNIMLRETFEEILQICSGWSSSSHLDVEEISSAPIFKNSLDTLWSDYGQLGLEGFRNLLRSVQIRNIASTSRLTPIASRLEKSTTTSAALVITRPPEIISIIKIATSSRTKPIYVSFDSHPRSKHPDGAAFIFHRSLDSAAHYLADLLRYDPAILADPSLHWQAQLLAQYSAHAFVTNPEGSRSTADTEQALVDASLELLKLKIEVAELRDVNRGLVSDSKSLAEENRKLAAKVADLQEARIQLQRDIDTSRALSRQNKSVFRSSQPPHLRFQTNIRPMERSPSGPFSGRVTSKTYNSSATASSSKGKQPLRPGDKQAEDDEHFATKLQLKWLKEAEYDAGGYDIAVQIQRQYEEEDRKLRSQLQGLVCAIPSTFECGICMDSFPEDVVARVELCGHNFCRPCLLQYMQSKLKDRRFPILCPTCSAQRGNEEPALISDNIASQLGLSEREFAILTELEMASFSVLVRCRQCNQSIFVDKNEYDTQKVITCPLPGCNHIWCKACSQSIDPAGPKHSCDGTSELSHLMTQQGWKNCPGCNTPTSKNEGCNHMTCITPGCNMHFCYHCGQAIIQSVRSKDIKGAIEGHYAKCRIFEVPPDS